MSDDQDGCEWVSVSSGTNLPGLSRTKAVKRLCVCVCVCYLLNLKHMNNSAEKRDCVRVCRRRSHADVVNGSILYIQDDLDATSDHFEFVVYDVENVLAARRADIAVRPRLARRQTTLRVTDQRPVPIGVDLLDATQLKVPALNTQ